MILMLQNSPFSLLHSLLLAPTLSRNYSAVPTALVLAAFPRGEDRISICSLRRPGAGRERSRVLPQSLQPLAESIHKGTPGTS